MSPAEIRTYEFLLDNKFFTDIDGPEVQKGKISVTLRVENKPSGYEMNFQLEGSVAVACDRCLDEMEMPIESNNRLIVKLGKEYAEESDEVLVVSEDEGAVNVAWFLYEFVALSLPIKRVHQPGKCNKAMSSKLRKHSARSTDDEEAADDIGDDPTADDDGDFTPPTDPRWDALKDLI